MNVFGKCDGSNEVLVVFCFRRAGVMDLAVVDGVALGSSIFLGAVGVLDWMPSVIPNWWRAEDGHALPRAKGNIDARQRPASLARLLISLLLLLLLPGFCGNRPARVPCLLSADTLNLVR
jgi:hypothetical protein